MDLLLCWSCCCFKVVFVVMLELLVLLCGVVIIVVVLELCWSIRSQTLHALLTSKGVIILFMTHFLIF